MNKNKYVFISQPMNGLSNIEILAARNRAKRHFEHSDYTVLESYFGNDFENSNVPNKGLLYLGESLKLMAKADLVYFCKGWQNARGCVIEQQAAEAYGIECVYEK